MNLFFSFLSGVVFGIGLILSGMTDPSKVIGFLDVTGNWNPTLGFVMCGAIFVSFFAFRKASKLSVSLTGQTISIPSKRKIDIPLILGSIIFGIGWGLAGYCPGPGIASIATGNIKPFFFVLAMICGMFIHDRLLNMTRLLFSNKSSKE